MEGGAFSFPSVEDLPAHEGLPDPFMKPDGTRVRSTAEWPAQRVYLKAMLAHYHYGVMPPRPKTFELERQESAEMFDGGAVRERYKITLKDINQAGIGEEP